MDELYHYGVVGMKWGVRRYQNIDGTLTDKGKRRYAIKGYSQDSKSNGERKRAAKVRYENANESDIETRAKKYLRDRDREKTKGWSREAKSTYRIQKRGVKNLSNKEIQEANKRVELEKRYKDLNPSKIEIGLKIATGLIAATGTIYTGYQNSEKLIKLGRKALAKLA